MQEEQPIAKSHINIALRQTDFESFQTDTSAISLVRFCGALLLLQLRSEGGRISPNDSHAESMHGLHQILVSLQILFHKVMPLHSAKSLRTFWTFQVFPEAGIPFLHVFVPLSYC